MTKQNYIIIAIVTTMLLLCGGAYSLVWYTLKQRQIQQKIIEIENAPLEEEALQNPAEIQPLDKLFETGVPRFITNAGITEQIPTGNSKVAIILDDLGMHESIWENLESMPTAITYAYLPYGKYTAEQAQLAHKIGHEIIIHLPMEPHLTREGKTIDPGPNALYTDLTHEEITERVDTNLKFLKEISVAVNNHMGSKFSEWLEGLNQVLSIVKEERMFFIDSVTTSKSMATNAAKLVDIPLLRRDIFLDHSQDLVDIEKALTKLEETAKKQGYAIAIGHPHSTTFTALEKWIPTLEQKGITLVPITNLLQDKINLNTEPDTSDYDYKY